MGKSRGDSVSNGVGITNNSYLPRKQVCRKDVAGSVDQNDSLTLGKTLQCTPKIFTVKIYTYTYKVSFKSNFIGEGGLFGDCQNKPDKK